MGIERSDPSLVQQVAMNVRAVESLKSTALARIARKGGRIIDQVLGDSETTTATSAGSAQEIVASNAVTLYAGRSYYVYCPTAGFVITGGDGLGIVSVNLTYTTNGSAPGAGSTVLVQQSALLLQDGWASSLTVGSTYDAGTTHTFRAWLGFYRALTGNGSNMACADNIELTIFDMGGA